jgi:preprotein translocase subunit SecG
MPPLPKSPAPKPLVFGKEEKPNLLIKFFLWFFICFAVGSIAMMIIKNPAQKKLTCHNSAFGSASLTSFGSCEEE